MAEKSGKDLVRVVLDRYGQTYAEQAGIRLADRPEPLYQLLVLTTLLSTRITAKVAVDAARELFAAGYTNPRAMVASSWQQRVDALGRGHYRRYDERTATMLGNGAQLCLDRWRGDLRRLHAEARDQAAAAGRSLLSVAQRLLTEFPGIGPTGADIFIREVQGVWPEFAPFLDRRVRSGAAKLRLPEAPEKLAGLVAAGQMPRLASALVRVDLDRTAPDELRRG